MAAPLILCSTGALGGHEAIRNGALMADLLHRLPGDGFEVLIYRNWDEDFCRDLARRLRAAGHRIQSVHARKDLGADLARDDEEAQRAAREKFELAVNFAVDLGAEHITLHLWELPASDEVIETNITSLRRLMPIANEAGVRVSVETLRTRVRPVHELLRLALQELPECTITIDIEDVAVEGHLEATLAATDLWSHVSNFHARDFDGQPYYPDGRRRYLNPGEGYLDFPGLFQQLAERSYTGLMTYEGAGWIMQEARLDEARIVSGVEALLRWRDEHFGPAQGSV